MAVLALGLLAGCGDGNPLSGSDDDTDTGTDPGTDTGTTDPIDSDGRLPPGTESPTPSSRIVR
ncbi:MAG TPA: plastocyanin, partial [Citreicella sp.]|nr:plastocyanin [Citreicella sp.]